MRELIVNKKTGFKVLDPSIPILIRDFRGMLFYSTESMVPDVTEFNLPEGKYFVVSGKFKAMENPVEYNLLKLPPQERVMPDPMDFQIKFTDNPYKCTINFKDKTITFDNSFKSKILPEIYFVLYHEYAHRYFLTEKHCDVLASNYMLKKGFNPSQIGRAHVNSLSHRQYERKRYNIQKMIEANGN